MELHTLLYDNDFHCLYCLANCQVETTSIGYPVLVIEKYTCQKCQEIFEVEHIDDKYYGFSFTCHNIRVFNNYGIEQFGLSKKDFDSRNRNNLTWIPSFNFSFSKKDDLYKKLKVYLVFA